ncbi:MAG: C40 family peptidase [Rhizobiaceae bacterium]|nr:C40 family peptidase [Rhizobiaceae bacterium]MCV0405046.1 C40 family peptidase [Rhizobiaceae bacterium]
MTDFDRRLNAIRPDLADERLRGKVEAERFVTGESQQVVVPVADLVSAPRRDAPMDTQLLLGDAVRIFERRDGWAWVQAEHDCYVGWLREEDVGFADGEARHVVRVPRSFVYAGPDLKLPRSACHSMGAAIRVVGRVETRGTLYAVLPDGQAMIASHLRPAGEPETDFVSVAETLLNAPYLWGGTSGFGVDCSGLISLSMRMLGRRVPRDTDMQAGSVGEAIEVTPDLAGFRRGDLVFWKGHVGMMLDGTRLLHASGHTMTVTIEPLSDAVARIGHLYGPPTGARRP